jgi:hypothetical protein
MGNNALHRIFLLSPAQCSGLRARLLARPGSNFDLARRLRTAEGAPLGEVFSFVSGLYFRAKLQYAARFANPPAGVSPLFVITPAEGLRSALHPMTLRTLLRYASVPIDSAEERYRRPLARAAQRLAADLAASEAHGCEIVLLGSIATGKYTDVLAGVFGPSLRFPEAFVGRGDMSRGGLMLRSVDAAAELEYIPVEGAVRHGPRPARLERRR